MKNKTNARKESKIQQLLSKAKLESRQQRQRELSQASFSDFIYHTLASNML